MGYCGNRPMTGEGGKIVERTSGAPKDCPGRFEHHLKCIRIDLSAPKFSLAGLFGTTWPYSWCLSGNRGNRPLAAKGFVLWALTNFDNIRTPLSPQPMDQAGASANEPSGASANEPSGRLSQWIKRVPQPMNQAGASANEPSGASANESSRCLGQ